MFSLSFLLVILSLALSSGEEVHPKLLTVPVLQPWPAKYYLRGTLFLPYVEIEEPFDAWYDGDNKRSRIDLYKGVSKTIQRGDLGEYGQWYTVHPWSTETIKNEKTCFVVNGTTKWRTNAQPMLPDVSKFKHIGDKRHKGLKVHVFQLKEEIGSKVNTYTLYVDHVNHLPLYYKMHGYNNIIHSHYDEYVMEYDEMKSNYSSHVFDDPLDDIKCHGYPPETDTSLKILTNPIQEYVYPVDESHVDAMHKDFVTKYKKEISKEEVESRKNTFKHNLRYIHSMNRRNLTYKLKVNHFADEAEEHFRHMSGLRVTPREQRDEDVAEDFNIRYSADEEIPNEKNWRLYGAVTPVKDQAICGSCWSFGAAGAVESAYFLKTGKLLRLSQQEQVDCSWGFGNNGCAGGEHWRAYNYMKKHGLSTEEEYGSYLAIDSYCHGDKMKNKVNVTGYVNLPSGNETALKYALFKHGPVAVCMDSSHKSFRFYSHGVYNEPKCGKKYEELGHLMLAVGYGTLDGESYWLVKNSWSTHWGNDGYFLIKRENNHCGILTDSSYPIVG